jgi:pimeloyl-ACP methyl ester carboxylesterase
MRRFVVFALALAALSLTARMASAGERVESDVPGGDAGISIHLTRKAPATPNGGAPILMLHAFGSPCGEAFDLAPGLSWLDDLTGAGFAAYAIDFRGFGQSSRPLADAPVDRAPDAVRDVVAVIEAIRKDTGAAKR